MRRYRISRGARRDLADIYRHVASRNPSAAGRLRDLFFDKFRLLAIHPLLGESRSELAENLRVLPAGDYLIAYQPTENGIALVRVLHAAQDIDAVLRRRSE